MFCFCFESNHHVSIGNYQQQNLQLHSEFCQIEGTFAGIRTHKCIVPPDICLAGVVYAVKYYEGWGRNADIISGIKLSNTTTETITKISRLTC